jgi:hypothetical protein
LSNRLSKHPFFWPTQSPHLPKPCQFPASGNFNQPPHLQRLRKFSKGTGNKRLSTSPPVRHLPKRPKGERFFG